MKKQRTIKNKKQILDKRDRNKVQIMCCRKKNDI